MSHTTWWKGPVSSSRTGFDPNNAWYLGTVRSRSVTVRATWVIAGNSAIGTSGAGAAERSYSPSDPGALAEVVAWHTLTLRAPFGVPSPPSVDEPDPARSGHFGPG